MKILFVCKHNRFRSKIAESAFNMFNKNKKIKCGSAGIFKGVPVSPNVMSIGREYGFKISPKTSGLDEKKMKEIDLVIVVADNVPASLFKDKVKEVRVWEIKDCNQNNKIRIKSISDEILVKVKKLVEEMR